MGSLGDLHPCLALALKAKAEGHSVAIATSAAYRLRVEAARIDFRPMRPHWDLADGEIVRQCENLRTGVEVLYRRVILPGLRDTYTDLLLAANEADLLVAGELVMGAPLVAEKLGLRWASAILSPCSFLSTYDPSVLVNVPWMMALHRAGQPVYKAALDACRLATRHWWNPVRQLRREQGLRRECDPLFRDKFAPDLVLALFSSTLAKPQPDWPGATVQTGFVDYDLAGDSAPLSPELAAFLAAGEPPIVFTQGTTAAHNAEHFFEASSEAARRLGRRALLLGAPANQVAHGPETLVLRYAPYSQVFPHAVAIVHQGGSGTLGQALRAGRPMLVVPYGWDQPDNGARAERLGVGLTLARARYSADTAERALTRLLADTEFARRGSEVATKLRVEDGLRAAWNAIEDLLAR